MLESESWIEEEESRINILRQCSEVLLLLGIEKLGNILELGILQCELSDVLEQSSLVRFQIRNPFGISDDLQAKRLHEGIFRNLSILECGDPRCIVIGDELQLARELLFIGFEEIFVILFEIFVLLECLRFVLQ